MSIAAQGIDGATQGVQGTLNKVTEALAGGGAGLFGVFDGPIMGQLWFWGKVILTMAAVAFGLMLFWKFWMQYKIQITIWRKVGAGWEAKSDRAKMIVDNQGKRKLQLIRLRNGKTPLTCPVPESQYLTKKGKKDHYVLFLDNNFQLHPTNPPSLNSENPSFNVVPQDRTAWGRFEDRVLEAKFKKKDFMEKYLPSVIIVSAMAFSFLIFFFAFKELGAGMGNLASQFSQIAASCTSLGP